MDKVKDFFIFRKDGATYENYPTKSAAGGAKGYRYPSPGSRETAVVPDVENEDQIYDIRYYTRDTARNKAPVTVLGGGVETKSLPEIVPDPLSSPGNKNPAVLKYDPTGTRSSMSATWEGMESELEKARADHLPQAWNFAEGQTEEELNQECADKGIPPVPGKPFPWTRPQTGKW
eukprot:CAMPEP_0203744838 /NCGR_PEP_ID=MMETSP0098-20131031/776_1 /ASSEMBLY_ACC=CAM_ASM_000208 /TAXON_ID=96639 /ORGANISM=" , Strain NY0313808BC1" /LENGTH=174 /DNA_ID=CAMNT_0050632461 /DNA_START=107 /DNA_END=631 /DNA_ORIENTATION=+